MAYVSPVPSRSGYATVGGVGGGGVAVAGGGGMVAAGGGFDLGCGGAENLCFEPSGMQASEGNWAYVGSGRGNYERVQQLQYVGAGGDYDKERVITYSGWKCRTCCICFLILLLLVGLGILIYFLVPTPQPPAREESTNRATLPFDCSAGFWNWEKAWSFEKKHWCCDHQDKGCSTTTSLPYDCAAGYYNWQAGWSNAKKYWCCAHFNKGCVVVTQVVSKPYECSAGLSNWENGWSEGKKMWCCAKENLGCTTSLPYDCSAGFSNWQAGWSMDKKIWCCEHKNMGCHTTTSLPYDCNAGFSNWQIGWSFNKKLWCCRHQYKGCHTTTSLPYDCDAGFSNWQQGWSMSKQQWCCVHTQRGCITTTSLPYDCDAGFSNWQAGWSAAKKAWCCTHRTRGCERTGSCTLWGDPHIFTFDHSRLVFYSEGDFWIVKSDRVKIQGRFQATDWTRKHDNTDYSSMTGIVVSGSFIQNHKIEIGPMGSGQIKCNGLEILHEFGTARCGDGTIYYNQQGQLVDSAMAFLPHRVVHMELPEKVIMQVNRWPNFINAKITMPQVPGQDGVCGDFNGVSKQGLQAGKELHAKFGYGVTGGELLFPNSIPLHIPAKSPSSKRCDPAKRQKAEAICHQEAADAVGWSFAECLGDVCDPHSSTAEEMKAALGQ
eukprot:TRINITY_DN3343_c0_g5_i1.p1 TRINITY_DN3343_c0_g5~~TRINITY_DN3343_c0_g5_i1.p1  ORF type:complete len:671 (-),score=90.98 TRINITY_DN3343_c0_g5_i1:58-2031(-)